MKAGGEMDVHYDDGAAPQPQENFEEESLDFSPLSVNFETKEVNSAMSKI